MNLPADSPFSLDNEGAYRRWREAKLHDYPRDADALLVPVNEPSALSAAEHGALLERVRKTNMAIYVTARAGDPDKRHVRSVGRQFGLERLERNFLADEDAISSITVNNGYSQFIPYTDRPIGWHTDGYYNRGTDNVRAMVLHCVNHSAQGGENALLDHEIAYLLLRDRSPDLVRAFMAPDAMTVPARLDEHGVARAEVTGPVFSVLSDGRLHMRYTERKRHIVWKDDADVRVALACLEQLLAGDSPYIFRTKLPAGAGLLCNNVLHNRTGFTDAAGAPNRLLYRARFLDRIAGS